LKELSEEVKSIKGLVQKKKPSDFIGIVSKEEAEEMQDYLKKARGEWDRDF